MQIIYNLSIYLYLLVIRIASLFNSKAKLWVSGRKNQELSFDKLRMTIGSNDSKSKIIWFHCASLGEFEQARPLIESLKFKVQSSKLPADLKIVLTFFSPSGYEIRKNYQYADYIFYLPIDTPSNARKFIETINPTLVFFVKYEFWFNYLQELKRKNIPTYLVSGIFRENHYFFKAYSNWFRRQLKCFTHFFLQDEKSMELLKTIGYTNTTFAGDTRFDRVADIAANVKSFPLIEQFKQDKNVFICGSTWAEDEKIICHYFSGRHPELVEGQQQKENNYKLIIAPHEIDENHIKSILELFKSVTIVRYSQANEANVKTTDVLIIDNIGMLSSLYQYGTIAYIGGGFGKGIHNILEAATFGLPTIFGPNYLKFNEAKELINAGGSFSIANYAEFEKTMQLLNDKSVLKTASNQSKQYVQSRVGATSKILNSIDWKS